MNILLYLLDAVQLPATALHRAHEVPYFANSGRSLLVRTFAHQHIKKDLGILLVAFILHTKQLCVHGQRAVPQSL